MDPTSPATPDRPADRPAVGFRPAASGSRTGMSRRSLLAAAGLIPLAGVAACGSSKSSPQSGMTLDDNKSVELSVFWWGGKARAENTEKALALYTQRHPKVTFKTSWQANQGYYEKLATLAASDSAPDLFQIDDNGLSDYTTRGVTLDLTPFVGTEIHTDGFSAGLRDSGSVRGKRGGIPAAENTPAMFVDRTALAKWGLAVPTVGASWDSLVTLGADVHTRSGGALNGTMDPSADYKVLEVWLRQQGKDLYTTDGDLGFTADDLARWFQFWVDAAGKHATPPADLIHTANSGDITKQLVTTQKGVTSFLWSNQLEEARKNTDHDIALTTYPGPASGAWARASMYWSSSAKTKNAARAADVINFLVNDPEAGKILGAERGLFPNATVRKQIESTLSPANQVSATFEETLASQFGPLPPLPPKGHKKVKSLLTDAAESVQYRKSDPAAAAGSFVSQAKAAIGA